MELLLSIKEFIKSYGLLLVFFVAIIGIYVFMFLRNKKFRETEGQFQQQLKKGDTVMTYSGFYGVVEKVTLVQNGCIVTLKTSENTFLDVDINAINSSRGIISAEELKEVPAEEKVEVVETPKAAEEEKVEIKEEPKEENK